MSAALGPSSALIAPTLFAVLLIWLALHFVPQARTFKGR